MPQVIHALGGGHTHTHTHTHKHTNTHPHKSDFKKPGVHQPKAWFKSHEIFTLKCSGYTIRVFTHTLCTYAYNIHDKCTTLYRCVTYVIHKNVCIYVYMYGIIVYVLRTYKYIYVIIILASICLSVGLKVSQ